MSRTERSPQPGNLDWRKSREHLIFLATFLRPRNPDRDPVDADWSQMLGEDPLITVERFLKQGILAPCGIREILALELPKLKVRELKALLKGMGMPVSGRKDELVARLVQDGNPGLLLKVPNRFLVKLSEEGRQIVEHFLIRGEAIRQETPTDLQEVVRKVLLWVLLEGMVAGVVGNAVYDLLKAWLSPEQAAKLPRPPAETPSPAPVPSPKQTPAPPETGTPKPVRRPAKAGRTLLGRKYLEPEMVRVPAGYFWMGSDEFDKQARDREKPRHRLYLPEYWIGRYPVTNREYRLFLLAHPERRKPAGWEGLDFPAGKADHPVRDVTWHDALAYCRWLSGLTGRRYLLPSEAEWEKAARGTDGRIYPWGDRWDKNRCNTWEGGIKDTTPVGRYSLAGDSPYGCADMSGNVWEWTRSIYKKYPYDPQDGRENLDAPDSVLRVLRGGSWSGISRLARCAVRNWGLPDVLFFNVIGFRIVLSLAGSGS